MKTYLIVSDSYKIRDAEVEKIIQDSLNVIKYDLRVDSLVDAINEANYFSLTSEMKYIVVNCGNLFKASKKADGDSSSDELKILEKYLDSPNENSTLVFISSELPDKRKKAFKKIQEDKCYLEFPKLNKKDLTIKCMELLKEKNYKIDYDVANFIVENSYVNYDIMTNELDKIYTLLKPQYLTIETLKDIISVSLSGNVYAFMDAIIKGDIEKSNRLCKDFEVLKIDSSMVLIMLAKEFEILYMIKRGVNLRELQYYLKKEEWQMKGYLENERLYNEKELKKIIIKLNDYDYKVKSGLLDRSVLLDLIILDLCE